MKDLIKIKDNPYLVKDNYSKAVLNINKNEVTKYINEVNKSKKVDKLENEVELLKRQINFLTSLLLKKSREQ